MKKRFIWIPVLIFFGLTGLGANEVSSVWKRLYRQSKDIVHRSSMLENIIEQHDPDMIPVLTEALNDLILDYPSYTSLIEKSMSKDLASSIVQELGRLKASDAADLIWEAYNLYDDNFVKAECLVSLGKVGARGYSQEIALILKNLNIGVYQIADIPQKESLTYGAIYALERLKKPEGFEPVFYASVGNQSRAVVVRANDALANMVADPTDVIVAIMEKEGISIKMKALEAEKNSKAPEDRKVEAASKAIQISMVTNPKTVRETQELRQYRILAAQMCRDAKSMTDVGMDAVSDLFESYVKYNDQLYSVTEVLSYLEALAMIKTDRSAQVVSELLIALTELRQSGYPINDDRVVRGSIIPLGNIASSQGQDALTLVIYTDAWSSGIKRLAKEVSEKL